MKNEDDKLFIVGFDGAEPDLIEKWVSEGELPNIENLINNGCFSRMKSTPVPISPAAWTSFMTGKNPGKHGVYDFVRIDKNYENKLVDSRDIDSETFWDVLSRNNKKVCSINIPNTYPTWKINGIMVSGFMSPSLLNNFAYPQEIERELRESGYRMESKEVYEGDNEEEVIKDSFDVIEKRTEAAKILIKKEDWDVFMVTFTESDRISHRFWKHMDKDHPLRKERDNKYEDTILKTYKKIDSAIGEILESSNHMHKATKIVVSDHGFGPLTGSINLNNWLLEEGYLKIKKSPLPLLKYYLWKSGLTIENVYNVAKFLGVAKYTKEMKEETRNFLLNFFLSFKDIDWSESKAFSAINFGPVFMNKNWYRDGFLDNKESEKIREEIIDNLKEIERQEEKVITDIYKNENIFKGDHLKEAPDITYKAKNNELKGSIYFEFGSNKLFSKPHRGDSGHHREDGILIISGPEVRNKNLKSSEIIDVAPTVLRLLNIPIPADIDGRVLKEITRNREDLKYIDSNSEQLKKDLKDIEY